MFRVMLHKPQAVLTWRRGSFQEITQCMLIGITNQAVCYALHIELYIVCLAPTSYTP